MKCLLLEWRERTRVNVHHAQVPYGPAVPVPQGDPGIEPNSRALSDIKFSAESIIHQSIGDDEGLGALPHHISGKWVGMMNAPPRFREGVLGTTQVQRQERVP